MRVNKLVDAALAKHSGFAPNVLFISKSYYKKTEMFDDDEIKVMINDTIPDGTLILVDTRTGEMVTVVDGALA